MAVHDFTSERLFLEADLAAGVKIPLPEPQAHYLLHVLRAAAGSPLLVFNGRDGEWRATLCDVRKRACAVQVIAQTRPQTAGPDIVYLFAPLKHARLDYMVQKAVEMGVAELRPVMTRHTVAERVNLDRMRANAIEAAEQCGVLRVPRVAVPQPLAAALAAWDETRPLVFCDEEAPVKDPLAALRAVPPGPVGVLIGPEGGFSQDERAALLRHPCVVALSLGPRIMRADTAAVAALTLVNATLGDWV